MSCFAPMSIRPQFPALSRQINGHPALFFDAPGGTQVPQVVIDAMAHYLVHTNANDHGAFLTSQATDAVIDAAHSAIADLLGCDPDEVIFGQNMTSLTFAVSRAIARDLGPGDEVLVTRLDHDANVAPWYALEERGVTVRAVDVDVEDCTLDMEDFAAKITPRTRVVAVGYASNAVGTINDIQRMIDMARSVGALTFVDAVHYAPHGPIDVRALNCDFLACSAYKFFAPHVGCLYGKREHWERLRPYKVRPAAESGPGRWETGTQNHEGLAGTTAAVDYLAGLAHLGTQSALSVGSQGTNGVAPPNGAGRRAALVTAMNSIKAYERDLSERLIAGILEIPGLTFYGIRELERFDQRTPTVSFQLAGHAPRAIADYLGQRGIFAWDGHFYAIGLSERLGVADKGGLVRVGLAHYNTLEEIDRFLEVLEDLAWGRE
ncbi:MAG: cysteine desulfurase-like protein [Chloroflexaceae bacterium]